MNKPKQPDSPQKFDFAVGGQAVIEGVMMRSANYTVISVRKQNGEIVESQEFYQNLGKRIKFFGLPLIRGIVNLFEMLFIGTKALGFASNQFMDESNNSKTNKSSKDQKSSFGENISLILTLAFSLAFSLFLFKFVPFWITSFISEFLPTIANNYILFNLIDGVIKTTLFISYIWLISFIPDLFRVFQYHGAEHKSIMTYEAGEDLTVENAKKQSRFHPRCGTSFILVVFLISILVYTFLPKHPDFWLNFGLRLMFLPVIASISYEFLKFSAKSRSKFVSYLTYPGLWMQKLTTKEPDDQMLEVALNSLKLALNLEEEFLNSNKTHQTN